MKIQYAGLKPVINEHGIFFKDGKEDKYKYLKYAIDILVAIDHPYEKKKKYSHLLNEKRISPTEILEILKFNHPNLEKTMQEEISNYLIHLDSEENDVKNRKTLDELEKDTFLNNLKIMREYKIQRAKNKIFYFHCIESIVEIILKNKIKEIDVPFNERFWHILQTIEGELSRHKISSNIKIEEIDGISKVMMNINIY